MRLQLILLAALGALALAAAAYVQGRHDGRAQVTAELAAVQADQREALAKLEAARLALQADRDRLALELEDAAREDPVTHPDALPLERVRRLARLR